ncbi:hypothetical protein [Cellulomonas marina]|uniref:Uncharacterized protein n=1 Tax=Cellulomonas marina TaxID=988821 RepID=A0A1I0ZNK9_9CELL|nr:hypothetical protein [Cellulomonas marina]GIG28877.1 hypothetical protein Cma02nite_14770 [Cellulomonas marina]SFB27235.1 hypothetical protein SAMN05421867_11218 [Cellulomonas marina]
MSEDTTGTAGDQDQDLPTSDEVGTADDPDADPGMLNPRTGGEASGGDSSGDPDADPDMLNPRTT